MKKPQRMRIATTAIAIKTSKATAAVGHRTNLCNNVTPATPRAERITRDWLDGNPVAKASLNSKLARGTCTSRLSPVFQRANIARRGKFGGCRREQTLAIPGL